MKIQHNIPAMNAYRNYTNNVSAVAKNLEKLSSGYRINRAGDDAAGLAISEKMRAQITGLETAQKNAKDGISLIQTAEGAMTEVHSMLNRMFELAEQSANGTYDNEVDRANLQKEFDALRAEIDRIADSSNFNGQKLLDGSLSSKQTVSFTKIGDSPVPAATPTFNTDTVLHKDPDAATQSSFSIDIGNVIVAGDTAATPAGDTLTLTIGGATAIEVMSLVAGSDYSTDAIMSGLKAKLGDSFALTVGSDTFNFDVTYGDDGLINFTQKSTDAKIYNVNNSVLFATKDGKATIPNVTSTGGTVTYNQSTINNKQGTAAVDGVRANTEFTMTAADVADGNAITIGNKTYTFAVGADSKFAGLENVIDLTDMTATDSKLLATAAERLSRQDNDMVTIGHQGGGVISLEEKVGQKVADLSTIEGFQGAVHYSKASLGSPSGKPLTLQIGDTADSYNMLQVNVDDIHTDALGIDASKINIAKQGDSQTAMDAIKNAINKVSSTRGDLGALQNRLEHTINNLGVMQENIQDAESSIRDTDVAKEMMAYTKNNILVQASQAMLAQANQLPQGVLQLLG